MSFFSDWHLPTLFTVSGLGVSAAALAAASGTPLTIAGAQAGIMLAGAAFAAHMAGRSKDGTGNAWGKAAAELGLDLDAPTDDIVAALTASKSGKSNDAFAVLKDLPAAAAVFDGSGSVVFKNAAFDAMGMDAGDLFDAVSAKAGSRFDVEVTVDGRALTARGAGLDDDAILTIWGDAAHQAEGMAAYGFFHDAALVAQWSPTGAFITGNAKFQELAKDLAANASDQFRAADGKRLKWKDILSGPFAGIVAWHASDTLYLDTIFHPIKGSDGQVDRILQMSRDVTTDHVENVRNGEFRDCVYRTSATIEFEPDGTILTANDAFLATMGYSLNQIVGKHHRMFAEPGFAETPEYAQLWADLGRGETKHGLFKRVTASGDTVYILGAYASVTDSDGKVIRVVKYVTDVTEQETRRLREKAELEQTRKVQAELVNALQTGLAELAQRDLSSNIKAPYPEGYDEICENFNNAVKALSSTLTEVKSASKGIDGNAASISGAANELASRTESQAATLEQSAASLDELTASMRSASDRTTEIEGQVRDAKTNAETGGTVVKDAVAAMSEIEQSSVQISQIISVIDDIAFQTNLLALNAGVEAARAGDAGRGFAVVASEVRALAQRSSEAAKEIKSHISQSTEHVSRGVDLVGRTGTALTGIVESFEEIERLITEVASSSRDQASGVSEINVAIGQLDRATQENAAMVEETTAAGTSLTADAQLLNDLVGRFRIAASDQPKAAAVQRAPANAVPPARSAASAPASIGNAALKLTDDDWEEF